MLSSSTHPSWASLLTLLTLTLPTTATLSAWWTEAGSQVLLQNSTTGHLTYSMCNSNSTPIFPTSPPLTLDTSPFPPRNGTALAGRGWYDGGNAWASIFYQSSNSTLINAVYACDSLTGKFTSKSTRVISAGLPADAAPHYDTGLAAVLLGAREGYRVFYHDAGRRVHVLTYADGVNRGEWAYGGVITGGDMTLGRALVAQHSSTRNSSVVYVRDGENVGVTRFNSNGRWYTSTFPRPMNATFEESSNVTAGNATAMPRPLSSTFASNFTKLPNYDGTARALGLSIDKAFTRNVFYIGTDRHIYQAANINYAWRMMNNQTESVWPPADAPGADIAVASDFESSIVRIYYESGGRLVEARLDTDGIWKAAVAVPAVNTTLAAVAEPSVTPAAVPAASGGLSTAARAGLAVGVAVGVLSLAGVLAVFFLIRRRNARQQAAEAEAAAAEQAKQKDEQEVEQSKGWRHLHPRGRHEMEDWNQNDYAQSPLSSNVSGGQAGAYLEWPAGAREMSELEESRGLYELGGGGGQYGFEMLGEGHYREMGEHNKTAEYREIQDDKTVQDWEVHMDDSTTVGRLSPEMQENEETRKG